MIVHMVCLFLLHICTIQAISSTWFWVRPLWFSALIIIFIGDEQDQGNTKPLQNAYLQAFWNEILIYGRCLSTTILTNWKHLLNFMVCTCITQKHAAEITKIWLKSPKCFYSYTSGFEFHIIWLYLHSTQSLFRSTLGVVPTKKKKMTE